MAIAMCPLGGAIGGIEAQRVSSASSPLPSPSCAKTRLKVTPHHRTGFPPDQQPPRTTREAPGRLTGESPGAGPETPTPAPPRRVPVSRMLSLPNDGYMFRPVAPAAPQAHPLQEAETEALMGAAPSGSAHPVRSWPVESRASLRLPLESSPARGSDPLQAPSPRGRSRSPSLSRPLCRQEAVHTDSLDGQADGCGEPAEKAPTRPASLGASPPRSPRPGSVRTRRHALGQRCGPSRPQAPEPAEAEAADPADEEVRHITSSARAWPPTPSPAAPGTRPPTRLHGVDAQGFLDTPGRASAEPSVEAAEAKARAPEAEAGLGARRKKKMSPPCISIEPPAEDDGPARAPATEGSSTTLRRRTPSCEAAPPRDSLEPPEGPGASADPAAKGERRGQTTGRVELLTVPDFAFEPLDMGEPSGDSFSNSGQGVAPETRASSSGAMEPPKTGPPVPLGDPPEKGQGLFLSAPQSPLKTAGPPLAAPTPDDGVDEPV
ncbi:voltage-dependent T-type calcium channel subunit alpha-1H [Choloepus didactylus]|uniref:voltage-dependent T-type calcium channel subunit alpha-1H n=1 Tax=Choloepus didactylus TaxID=27675 RepID=UPI0018A108F5|nr:voltage-dependent T-type calcium channel subunit alpha-1H [Choloepus didactylus]